MARTPGAWTRWLRCCVVAEWVLYPRVSSPNHRPLPLQMPPQPKSLFHSHLAPDSNPAFVCDLEDRNALRRLVEMKARASDVTVASLQSLQSGIVPPQKKQCCRASRPARAFPSWSAIGRRCRRQGGNHYLSLAGPSLTNAFCLPAHCCPLLERSTPWASQPPLPPASWTRSSWHGACCPGPTRSSWRPARRCPSRWACRALF